MAVKKVAVRLVAEGGKLVRAELDGIGTAGEKSFGEIEKSSAAASVRLKSFARAAGVAAAAAVTAAAAAGVAMIRNGLQTVDAQAKLAASLDTTVASIQVLERAGELAGVAMTGIEQATKDLTRRLSQAASGAGPATAALKRLGLSAEELMALPLDQRVGKINQAILDFVPAAERAAVAGQLFGEEGSIAMSRIDTATLRTATQDVREFGVAVSQQDAAQIERTNDAISRLQLVGRGMANTLAVAAAPALEGLADAMAQVMKITGPVGGAINTVLDNLDRLASYATVAAGALTLRMIPAIITGALAVARLTRALVLTRAALIRTGWGVAIVAAGELAYQLGKVSEVTDASSEAQARMNEALGLYAQVGGPAARAEAVAATQTYVDEAAAKLESAEASLALLRAMQQEAQARVPEGFTAGAFANDMAANDLRLAIEATDKLQAELVAARARLAEIETSDPAAPINAAGLATTALSNQLNGAISRASRLTQALGHAPDALRGLQDQAAVLNAGLIAAGSGYDALGVSVAQYRAGLEREYGLAQLTHYEQRQLAQDQIDAQVTLYEANQRRQAQLDSYISELSKVEPIAAAAGAALVAAAEAPTPPLREQLTGWAAVNASLADYATSAMDWGKGLADTLTGAFHSAESAFRAFTTTGKFDFKAFIGSLISDLAVLSFRTSILGPLAKWLGGALGGAAMTASVLHAGGMAGSAAPSRQVPAALFADAPRLHEGGWAGLAPDEVPAILQRGERVLSRRETGAGGSGGSGQLDVRLHIDRDGNWQAAVEKISGAVSVTTVEAGIKQYDRLLPRRMRQIGGDARRIG